MTATQPATQPTGTSVGDTGPLEIVIVAFLTIAATVWFGGLLAASLAGHPGAPIGLSDAGLAALRLPKHLADPKLAWPPEAQSSLPGPVGYWTAHLLLAAAVGGGVVAVRWAREAWRSIGSVGDDEARFAAARDLAGLLLRTAEPERITLGRLGGRLVSAEPQASVAVVGPTGCGKTAGFAIPAMLEWTGPVLATSVKGDLLERTFTHRAGRGTVWVYDPTGAAPASVVDRRAVWSPVTGCGGWRAAQRMALWMTTAARVRTDRSGDNDYWYSQARKALAPYLHAAALAGFGLADVVSWVDGQDDEQAVHHLSRHAQAGDDDDGFDQAYDSIAARTRHLLHAEPETPDWVDEPVADWPADLQDRLTNLARRQWARESGDDRHAPLAALTGLLRKDPRIRDSTFATLENVLVGWSDPGVLDAATRAETDPNAHRLDPAAWLAGDHTVHLVAPAHEQDRLRPVITVLVQLLVRAGFDTANQRTDQRLEHPCLILLDEAGNIAPVADLPAWAATARSHRITLVSIWQDLAQIKTVYGERAPTVLNNHTAKLFGGGIADTDTLNDLSRLVGDAERSSQNLSVELSGGRRRSMQQTRTWRPVASPDLLRRLAPGEAVLVYGRLRPARLRLRPWFDDPTLTARARTTNPSAERSSRVRLPLRHRP